MNNYLPAKSIFFPDSPVRILGIWFAIGFLPPAVFGFLAARYYWPLAIIPLLFAWEAIGINVSEPGYSFRERPEEIGFVLGVFWAAAFFVFLP